MKRPNFVACCGLAVLLSMVAACSKEAPAPAPRADSHAEASPESKPAAEPKKIEIDLDRAIAITLPAAAEPLKPVAFKTPDGREGWVVKLPNGLPLATPAIDDGRLFIGGGYGSHEFYALDAKTGALAWEMKTSDDGPTAAVVEEGLVAFNTESCTVIVAEAKTGKLVWQEWLGDPLMSQPAVWNGRLYIAHPAGQRPAAASQPAPAVDPAHPHRLLCAELKTGRHLWDCPITGDIVSAPVVSQGKALFTCFDGTSFCVDASSGKVLWEKANQGTSAPVVAEGRMIMTLRETHAGKNYEGIVRIDPAQGTAVDSALLAKAPADYLNAGQAVPAANLPAVSFAALDASVGFGTAPEAAKLGAAGANLGVQTVAGAWAYQGSKAAYQRGQIMNAQGAFLNCLDARTGAPQWRAECLINGKAAGAQVFSPPSLGRENMYVCGPTGHLASIRQKDGQLAFLYDTKTPMASQPALSGGNVYVGAANGLIICLRTGGDDADGWTAWGGNGQHNKAE